MGLSGIEIFKLLPKTNCKDCGVPTCLAFAMNLAAGKAELSKCPHVSDEAKGKLAADAAPPIRTITFGTGDNAVPVGGETVCFRHEKTFFNKTGIAVLVSDADADDVNDGKIARLKELQYLRVGLNLRAEMIAVKCASGDAAKFAALAKKVVDNSDGAMILMADKPELFEEAIKVSKERKPLLYAATADNVDAMATLAKETKLPLAVKGENLDQTAELSEKLTKAGLEDLVLDPGSRTAKQSMIDEVVIRRSAVQKKIKPLGFPTIAFPCEMADDFAMETVIAGLMIPKYAGIIVLSDIQGENLFPLLLERLNIYTDPQRPMKTEQGIYEINNPGPDAPVLITSNFSLTYFVVSGEIEASRVPTYLLVLDTDGLSVLTAWAAGKFVGDVIGMFVKKCGIAEKSTRKNLVLPGLTAVISGDVEEELGSEWTVSIGPREAAHVPAYLKQNFA